MTKHRSAPFPALFTAVAATVGGTMFSIVFAYMLLAIRPFSRALGIHSCPGNYRTQTRTDAQAIRGAAERFLLTDATNRCPTVQTLVAASEISANAQFVDPWNVRYRLRCVAPPSSVEVVSAGPDRRFGTRDDITPP